MNVLQTYLYIKWSCGIKEKHRLPRLYSWFTESIFPGVASLGPFVTSPLGGSHSGSPALDHSLFFLKTPVVLELWSSLSMNIPWVCVYISPVYNTFCSIYLFSLISTKTTASKNQNIKMKLTSYFYFFHVQNSELFFCFFIPPPNIVYKNRLFVFPQCLLL